MAIQVNPNQFLHGLAPKSAQNKMPEASKALTQSLSKAIPGLKIGEKQSPEATAKNILGFVKNGLSSLASQGASSERLQQRLDAAKEGIEKGYKEAVEILKGLGLYDEQLKGEVEEGRKLVDSGLESLANNLDKLANKQPVSTRSVAVNAANSMTLEVLTREGDRVTVSFAQQKSMSQSSDSFSASAAQGWSMEVQGHLSEAEQSALATLFDDVQSLSEKFFAGDIGSALESAMNLGYDGQQLASLSLQLTQRTSFSATSPYSAVQEQLPTPELESLKAPLASYVDSYMNALDKAKPLANPMQALQDMMQQLLPAEERMPVWESFHNGLNQLLSLSEKIS